MKTLNLKQGSDEWLSAREGYNPASEAPSMMGVGPISRSDLVQMKATGDKQEYSKWTQEVLFERGHQVEAAARPLAEELIGEELYPVTGVDDDGYLLASFDGLTGLGDVCWECKQWSERKAAHVREHGDVPEDDYWQVQQQLHVSGAERCLYMVTDGTSDRCEWIWVRPNQKDIEDLIAHWRVFDADVKAYQHREAPAPILGSAPDSLPALHIEVKGQVVSSNLVAFREASLAVLSGIKTDLSTDQDFADAEKTVKWCKGVEERLEAAKDNALAQTSSIEELFRVLGEIKEETRSKRLALDSLIGKEKKRIRAEILAGGQAAVQEYVEEVNASAASTLAHVTTNDVQADFAGAMRNKRTVKSLRDAVDGEAARVKVQLGALYRGMAANALLFENQFQDFRSIFPDLDRLVRKAPEDFKAVVSSRIAEYEAEEARKAQELEDAQLEDDRRPAAERAEMAANEDEPSRDFLQPWPVNQPPAKGPTPVEAPSREEIVALVSSHYDVTNRTASLWLSSMFGGVNHE